MTSTFIITHTLNGIVVLGSLYVIVFGNIVDAVGHLVG
jgi:hypothetical protein